METLIHLYNGQPRTRARHIHVDLIDGPLPLQVRATEGYEPAWTMRTNSVPAALGKVRELVELDGGTWYEPEAR